MIDDSSIEILPEDGIVSVISLAKMMDIGVPTLINGLTKQGVPYIKLSKFHRHWMIRLKDLQPKQ